MLLTAKSVQMLAYWPNTPLFMDMKNLPSIWDLPASVKTPVMRKSILPLEFLMRMTLSSAGLLLNSFLAISLEMTTVLGSCNAVAGLPSLKW